MLDKTIKKDIFKYKQRKKYLREVVKIIKNKYKHLNLKTNDIKHIYKIAKPYSYYYIYDIPCTIYCRIIKMYGKCTNPVLLLKYFNSKYGFNLSINGIRTAALRANISRDKKFISDNSLKLKKKDQENIINMYLNNKTSVEIAKIYNCTPKTILDILNKHNIQRRKGKLAFVNNRNYPIIFDKIDTEFKAYFLGFMLTDGYLTRKRNNISIQLKDYDAIKFISEHTNGTIVKLQRNMYRTSYYSKEDIENLKRLGVVFNKSLTLQGPNLLNNENQYLNYIIRGIIDGDGWIRKDGKEFFICSASEDFIKWCKMSLESLGMQNLKYNFINNEYNGIFCLRTAISHNINILREKIYDKPYGMKRKYLRVHEGSETIIQVSYNNIR